MIITKYTPKGMDLSTIPFYYAQVIKDITGIMPVEANVADKTTYPYITIETPSLHDTEAQGSTRNSEMFKTTIMLNVYADNARDAINISSDIQTLITTYPYIDQLHKHGIGVLAPVDGGMNNLAEFNLNSVFQASIRQQLRIINLVKYTGPSIQSINQGGRNIANQDS